MDRAKVGSRLTGEITVTLWLAKVLAGCFTDAFLAVQSAAR